MRPYVTLKLEQWPDVADLKAEGRPRHLGSLKGRSLFRRAAAKHRARRYLRRLDRRNLRLQLASELAEVLS